MAHIRCPECAVTFTVPPPRHLPPHLCVPLLPIAGPLNYEQVHRKVRNTHGPASDHACVECGKPANQWAYDHTDPMEYLDVRTRHWYSADPRRYQPMCIPCHMRLDRYRHVRHTDP